jgi:hypothetical protein
LRNRDTEIGIVNPLGGSGALSVCFFRRLILALEYSLQEIDLL